MNCSGCAATVTEGDKFCAQCGAKVAIEPAPAPCRACAEMLPAGAKFCVACGTADPLSSSPSPAQLAASQPSAPKGGTVVVSKPAVPAPFTGVVSKPAVPAPFTGKVIPDAASPVPFAGEVVPAAAPAAVAELGTPIEPQYAEQHAAGRLAEKEDEQPRSASPAADPVPAAINEAAHTLVRNDEAPDVVAAPAVAVAVAAVPVTSGTAADPERATLRVKRPEPPPASTTGAPGGEDDEELPTAEQPAVEDEQTGIFQRSEIDGGGAVAGPTAQVPAVVTRPAPAGSPVPLAATPTAAQEVRQPASLAGELASPNPEPAAAAPHTETSTAEDGAAAQAILDPASAGLGAELGPDDKSGLLSVPRGWPDITEEISEVRFLHLQGLERDVKEALAELGRAYRGHPDFVAFATELGEDGGTVETPPRSGQTMPPPSGLAQVVAAPPATLGPTRRPVAPVPSRPQTRVPVLPRKSSSTAPPPPPPPPEPLQTAVGRAETPAPLADAPEASPASVPPAGADPSERLELGDGDIVVDDSSPVSSVHLSKLRTTRGQPRPETVVTRSLQPAAPFGDDEEPGAKPTDERGAARRAPRNATIRLSKLDGPLEPAPFAGDATPGSTLVPGTTPPLGGFSDTGGPSPRFSTLPPPRSEIATPGRRPNAGTAPMDPPVLGGATPGGVDPADDRSAPLPTPAAVSELVAAAIEDAPAPIRRPTAPLPLAPIRNELPAAVTMDSPIASAIAAERAAPPSATSEPQSEGGTVVARAPMPPAPFEPDEPDEPVAPVRVVMIGAQGQPVAERILIPGQALDIGRDQGEPWGDDEFILEHHARLAPAPGGGVFIDDFGGTGPVFRQLEARTRVSSGDEFRVGQSALRLERSADTGARQLSVRALPGDAARIVDFAPHGVSVGRDDGELVLPDDTYVSGQHCRFVTTGDEVYLEDLDSSNGTYIRVRNGETVGFDGLLLIGHSQFKVQPLS